MGKGRNPADSDLTAFLDGHVVARGPAGAIVTALREVAVDHGRVLVFDGTGRAVDVDLRETPAEPDEGDDAQGRGRGRPKLGVIAREVTLLPRHWDWLAEQRGGASAVLRRLIDEARHREALTGRTRAAQDAAYRFMAAIAGDEPGFEEASRALYAGDRPGFEARVAGWPADVRDHAMRLAGPGWSEG
ncbi:DUF2239 family protein [Aurantimonas sp. MSK8Z-1]|uniref:DUF2239 family protein n=1 Tax=Mangrovibrevibacter kandeliae TaxID=2968473 RepID=UPI0021198A87|nr:DUF2239 family protein [Aurantimonas sp. MSK8Z-1]MCW4116036.1 DUF2239 family protein [Aurantimonas sp. MSK8Z-1]